MRNIEEVFAALGRSEFRRRFRLRGKEDAYLREKGLTTVLEHARETLSQVGWRMPTPPMMAGRRR